MEENELDIRETFYPEGVQQEEVPTTETPSVDAAPVFPSPFQAKYGNSSVDLSIKDNNDKMLQEYDAYWNEKDEDKRNQLGEEFHQKYYGMSLEEAKEAKRQNMGSMYGSSNPLEVLNNTFQGMATPGMGLADFFLDAAGTLIPGMDRVDDAWDEATKFDNQYYQGIRRISSIVLPSMLFSNVAASKINQVMPHASRFTLPWWKKLTASMAVHGLGDAGILGLSDVGEDDSLTTTISEMFPETFGPKGRIPLPDLFRTTDSDSPGVRKVKNMLESAPFSIFGSIAGIYLDNNTMGGAKRAMQWFEPLDDNAVQYKRLQEQIGAETADLIRLQEIDQLLSMGGDNLSKQMQDILINEKLRIEEALGGVKSVDDAMKQLGIIEDVETSSAIDRKLESFEQLELDLNASGLDPDINKDLLSDAATAKQTTPQGNIARNMADTTAIKNGTSSGDPAPIITDSMRKKGLMVGPTSRDAVVGVGEAARIAGRFDAVVDGVRVSSKEMNAAAWGIYQDIINPESTLDDVKKLFLENRDVKNLLMGKFQIEVINEDQARAAAFAMRDLVDKFLGREVTESSARVMDTLGREAATISQAVTDMAPFIDDNRAMDIVLDKLLFLMDEYALNKYLSGWSLRNKNWFDQIPPQTADEGIETLLSEFQIAENSIHAKNLKFTKELKRLAKENPAAIRPLVDAFGHTNGDVDSLAKLFKWAEQQVTPTGLLKSPDPKNMNLFAKAAWGVRYNNMLSGISAFRAALGNTAQLVLRPMTALLGHGITGNIDGIKRTIYYNTAVFETNRRALIDGFQMLKKTHKDPTAMMRNFRKDFVFKTDTTWDILDDVAKLWEAQGEWGKAYQYKTASTLKQMAGMKGLRYGMTAMVFPDVFTNTHIAHYMSRVKAYEDVFAEFGSTYGRTAQKALAEAESRHYKSFFNADGLIKDDVVNAIKGEIQLNLDDGLSTWLNDATTAYPVLKEVMAFPRTASNSMKAASSWTPITLIPGLNKYSKTIYARSQEDIAAALLEHGINVAKEPHAKVIFENLRAEYIGRLAFAGLLTTTLFQYAMAGNIRGNGHYNQSRRNKERDEMGYEPKTINIGGRWVSFKGIVGIDQILTLIGDMAYYAGDADEHILENYMGKLTWTIGATFLNESPLAGVEPLFDALNGNVRAFRRLVAQSARSWIPQSGSLGVVASAIDSAQKDIGDDWIDYIKNSLPGFKNTLPNQIDIWTGDPLNDINNPWLRVLNAISPVKVSEGEEPWRRYLRDIGYNGLSMLSMDSTGSYEWEPAEREAINKLIGEQKLYKEIERIMKVKRYNDEIKSLKDHRKNNAELNKDRIKLKTNLLPVHQEINMLLRNALKLAESQYLAEHPNVQQSIINAIKAKAAMKTGDVQGAAEIQKRDLQTKQLIEYGN